METLLQQGTNYEIYVRDIIKEKYQSCWLWKEIPNDILLQLEFIKDIKKLSIPILLNLLARIGVVNSTYLKKTRRYVIVIIFTAAAILTPPDVMSQLLMAAPLIVLYGVSIYIAKIFNPAPKEEEEEEE